jgi:hypothetical protein
MKCEKKNTTVISYLLPQMLEETIILGIDCEK